MSLLAGGTAAHVPLFMLMSSSVCAGAPWLPNEPGQQMGSAAPRGEEAMLNIHSAAHEFQTAPWRCVLKKIGKRLGEPELKWFVADECWGKG